MDTTTGTAVAALAAAVRERLPHGTRWLVRPAPEHGVVDLVHGAGRPVEVVAAAITEDGHTHEVVRHAGLRAGAVGARLRVVHVWSGRRTGPVDGLAHTDLLLSLALYDALDPDVAAASEREVLHDRDPGRALRALSKEVGLLVLAAGSDRLTTQRPLGETAGALVGRTRCPLVLVLPATPAAPLGW